MDTQEEGRLQQEQDIEALIVVISCLNLAIL